jgi:copper oxidase (laccase) domain-containing protein
MVTADSEVKSAEVDALITTDPDVLLGIHVADCCAVFLVDPRTRAIGLVHSGRKGTELNIVGAAVQKMETEFGTDPADLIAQLGPCIRPPHYEVDFGAKIIESLRQSGVRHAFDSGENTAVDLEKYYSYRMEKGRTGRMLALLALQTPNAER